MDNAKIAAAFVKAQKGFGSALKTATNPHFKSKYADLSACVEAVIDSLHSNGIGLMQHTHDSESGVVVETVFIHESGEMMSSGRLHVPASKQDPQGYGSALTYARRYSLMAACGIAPEDDDGNAASKKPETAAKPQQPGKLTEGEIADFLASISAAGDVDALKEYYENAFRVANKRGDTTAIIKFVEAKDKRKNQLLPDVAQ